MKKFGSLLILIGIIILGVFGYQMFSHKQAQDQSMIEAKERIESGKKETHNTMDTNTNTKVADNGNSSEIKNTRENFFVNDNEAFATLEIPKLGKTLPIVEGTDPDSLAKGVGHLSESVFPGQDEQILVSGHRDTVFRDFGKLQIGDNFKVNMPYGTYDYEIKETEIVPEDDTTVIREMDEEVLVVTTCYPFSYVGNAPDRFVAYAYPVTSE